jgi:RPA family protein
MAEQESSKRHTAHKVSISDILENKYVREEGWLPNYIEINQKKVSRVNFIGVIISKEKTEESYNFVVDDGSGRVQLRFFEKGEGAGVGDLVTVIGRPREFGGEAYIVPEIIKKINNPEWVEVRKNELKIEKQKYGGKTVKEEPEELAVENEEFIEEQSPTAKILDAIRELDSGAGVSYEEITEKSKISNAEQVIRRLLEEGDVFEIKSGRYKVLE